MGILKQFEESPTALSRKGATPKTLPGANKASQIHTDELKRSFDGQLDLDGKTPDSYEAKIGGIKSGEV
tara:strand:+ start:134 stop:340 length:207 start_codon:yes stop_codon:yes gene_type:complete